MRVAGVEEIPEAVLRRPRGMLGDREAAFMHYAAMRLYTGKGEIVDAGSYLGSSAYCFAAGLAANGLVHAKAGRIHSFDRFVVGSQGMVETIAAQTGERLQIGGSYLPIYERHLAPYSQLVRVHKGDFAEAGWGGQPIELLLVDISKTLDLNRKIVELFFSKLIPGLSLVIHQDYFHYGQPWIHITMEYLGEYFENDPEKIDDTSVFKCVKELPESKVAELVRYNFTRNEQLSLMSRAIERSSKAARPYLELNNCMLIRSLLGEAEFVSQVSKIASSYKSFDDHYHWKKYLSRVVAMTTASSAA